MDFTGASGAIPRSDTKRLETHAKQYYESIRKRTDDVYSIAANTEFTIEDIQIIKKHIFLNEYELDRDIMSTFDPDYDMAVSWQRLIDGKDIHEMDIVLLNHELLEYSIMTEQGVGYNEAHKLAEQTYNYSKFVIDLNKEAGIL
jgi:hypothetical protein